MAKHSNEAEAGYFVGELIMSTPQGQAVATALAHTVAQGGAAAVAAGGAAITATAAIAVAAAPIVIGTLIGIGVVKLFEALTDS
jgi:hypothetical protein